MKKQWSLILAIILGILVAVLSVLNVDPVPINFGFTEVEWPLILVILGSLLIGALIVSIISTSRLYHERKDKKKLEKKLNNFEEKEQDKINKLNDEHHEEVAKLNKELKQEKKKERELERRLSNKEKAYINNDSKL